uniref:Uncharacterized protein n=1 Tax=Solanum tuberosum TaxID=4113 RepID=M1A4A5_SOLTU
MRLDRESLISTDMTMKTTTRNKAAKSNNPGSFRRNLFAPDGSAETRYPTNITLS